MKRFRTPSRAFISFMRYWFHETEEYSKIGLTYGTIELFSLGVMAEALLANICSKSAISLHRGPVDQQFQVEVVAPPTFLLLRKLG